MDPIVRVASVTRVFRTGAGNVFAVRDMTFTVNSGESVAITGPSGSGKTTLLNLLAALDRPSSGHIVVAGNDLIAMDEAALTRFRASTLGIVVQEPHLLPGLTALENVVAGRLPWSRWRDLRPRAQLLLDRVGLGHRLDHPPAKLSGGERQRVAVARALLGQPSILLADEPTGNVDARTTQSLLELLKELQTELALTMVIASHDPLVAATADRVVNLRPPTEPVENRPALFG